jgi:hypothetical protein
MAFDCMPYGTNTANNMFTSLYNFYNDTGEGCCGCMETLAKWVVVAPAHLLSGALAVPALMVYDLVMACFFALANLCTAFTIEELRDRLCGHFTSFLTLPNRARDHLIAACFTPVVYHGMRVIAQG